MLFQLASLITTGAILELSGESSHLEMNGASLSVSCPNPATFSFGPVSPVIGGEVEVPLIGVPTSCAGIPLGQPCVETSKIAPRPPMFQCAVSADANGEKNPAGGKIHATLKEIRSSMGELLDVEPVLKCPLGELTTFALVEGASNSVLLSLSFGDLVLESPVEVSQQVTFSFAPPAPPVLEPLEPASWVANLGGPQNFPKSVVFDAAGNTYVAGAFKNKFETLTPIGALDAFVACYDRKGALQWAVQAGGKGNTVDSMGVAVDEAGQGLFVIGRFSNGNATFGGTTLTSEGHGDGFVMRLSMAGEVQWAIRFGGDSHDGGLAVAAAGGKAYITGTCSKTCSFGTGSITFEAGQGSKTIVMTVTKDGEVQWVKKAGDAYNNADSIAVDADGTSYISGDRNLVSFNSDGQELWRTGINGRGTSIAIDANRGIYVMSLLNGNSPAVNGKTLQTEGEFDVFVFYFSNTGNGEKPTLQWASRAGGNKHDYGGGIAVGPAGTVHVVGLFTNTLTFTSTDGQNYEDKDVQSAGADDIFIMRLSSTTGGLQSMTTIGGSKHERTGALGASIAVNSIGNEFIAGYFGSDSVDFGNDLTLSRSNNVEDGFVLAVPPPN